MAGSVGPGLLAVEALERMERNRRKPISILPVLASGGGGEDRQLQGLLRLHDLVQAGLTSGRSPQP